MRNTELIHELKTTKNANESEPMNSLQKTKKFRKLTHFALLSGVVAAIALEPTLAMATTDNFGNIQTVATRILGFFTGPFGRTIATIAVIVMGMMAMFGKLAWDHAIKVIIGVAIVFGAAGVINAISGAMETGPATGSGATTGVSTATTSSQ